MRLFAIVDDRRVHAISQSQVTIDPYGTDIVIRDALDATISLNLRRDEASRWFLKPRDRIETIRGTPSHCPAGQWTRFQTPFAIRLGSKRIEFRDVTESHAIRAKLRLWMHDVETRLHVEAVDSLRRLEPVKDEQIETRNLEHALGQQLKDLNVPPELENYFAQEAIIEAMVDHATGLPPFQEIHDRGLNLQRLVDSLCATVGIGRDETPAEKVERIQALSGWAGQLHAGEFNTTVRKALAHAVLRRHLRSLIRGLGPLETLIGLDDVNDVMVLPSGAIYVERGGVMQDSGRRMLSPTVSSRILERIVGREGRRIDQSTPMVDARTSKGHRLNAVIPPLSVDGPALTLRRGQDAALTIDAMVKNGSLTPQVGDFLRACVAARKSILISGGTGSGKTTLLRELAAHISDNERIVTIEDTAELRLPRANMVQLQSRPANVEGQLAVSIRDLVRNALRMRPDRILVGECRGGEALDMLQAMNTGHEGSMTTVHANTPVDALLRLETMALQAEEMDLPSRVIRQQIARAIDVIVQVDRVGHRLRRVTSVCEALDLDPEDNSMRIEEIYEFRRVRTPNAITMERLTFTGYVPSFFEELMSRGASVECLR